MTNGFKQTPINMNDLDSENQVKVTGNVPPAFAKALNKEGISLSSDAREEAFAPKPERSAPPKKFSERADILQKALEKARSINKYEEITLPSKGVFYDGVNGPKDGILHIRPMTGNEEKILANSRLQKRGVVLDMVFDECIQEDYKSVNFLGEDRTYILLYLRGISLGTSYDVEITCPNCTHKWEESIDLNGLEVTECPENFNKESLYGKTPLTGLEFTYRLLTGEDQNKIAGYGKKKDGGSSEPLDNINYSLALAIEEIEGITDKEDIETLISQLISQDINYIRNLIMKAPFGVDTKVGNSCPNCNHEFEVELPIGINFFFPKGPQKK